jgi:hypothetical protein
MPKGVVLHGSRSGVNQSTKREFDGTRRWATVEPDGLGWNVTVGDDEISIHMPVEDWGWHARACSSRYLSCEFAQGIESLDISDAQVRTFCWWMRRHVFNKWPALEVVYIMPTHAEVEHWGETGKIDGKTDVFSFGSSRTEELRNRIKARLRSNQWVPV